jgi:hypothetical protein
VCSTSSGKPDSKGAHVQVERIGDLVALDCPAFTPNVSKGAQP